MPWAAAEDDRMHVIGGYAEGGVARPFHHVFDSRPNAWRVAAPIPRGANHIGVAATAGVVFAVGGFVEQNRVAVPDCYAYVVGTMVAIGLVRARPREPHSFLRLPLP
jgi:hypothetical protein